MKKFLLVIAILSMTLVAGCKTLTGSAKFEGKSDQQLYEEGTKAVKKGRYKVAVTRFEALDALYPFSPYAQKGQQQIIYAYFKSEDWASTAAAADRFIHLYPRDKDVDYAYYIKGIANMKRNRNWSTRFFPLSTSNRDLTGEEEAFNDFSQLISLYPNSQYVEDARKRMIYIRDELAHHEINVADFYYARSAYAAAANRASYVVRHFQGSRFVKEALVIMMKSYEKMGKKDLENDARKVFKQSFPNDIIK